MVARTVERVMCACKVAVGYVALAEYLKGTAGAFGNDSSGLLVLIARQLVGV